MNEKQSTGIFGYNVLRCTLPSSIPKNDFEEASCFQVLMFCCPPEEAQDQNYISIQKTDKGQK